MKLLILVIPLKKLTATQKINANEKKKLLGCDHDKYITTQEFNKWKADNFVARLAKAKLASKDDIANFFKKLYFYDKLKL